MNSLNQADCAAREAKHVSLHEAISSINEVGLHAAQILNKIKARDTISTPEAAKVPMATPPSLEDVLAEGPERIRIACNDAHELLNEIDACLF